MPLFPNASTYYKGRTHTQLVISEGNAPAEKYIPSAATNASAKFTYEFGPQGNQEVVIPKGKAVAISGMEWDYETEHMVPAIKIANGLTDIAIGVNHHNVYKRTRDRFGGNQPTIITREYIELPLFGSQNAANDIKFGAAWATDPKALLGKYVAIDEYGNFTLATGAYANADIIGQCLAIETDVPPAGYLQYFLEMEDADFAKFMKDMSYAPSPGKTRNSAWNDIEGYPEGTGYLKSKEDLLKSFRSGIPFLTDGYFKARTTASFVTGKASAPAVGIEPNRIKTTGSVKVDLVAQSGDPLVDNPTYGQISVEETVIDGVTVKDLTGASIFLRLPETLVKDNLHTSLKAENFPEFGSVSPSDVSVKLGGAAFAADRVHVDYTNNQVVLYLEGMTAAEVEGKTIEVTGTVLRNQIPGIPTGWDFQGNLGAARILLQK